MCGERDFSDLEHLNQTLNSCLKWWNLTTIIHGGAKGADSLAHTWARNKGLNVLKVNAQWDLHGKAAGMIRNKEMLDLGPDVVIAFKGGVGTEGMITIARKAGVPVFIV